MRWNSDLILERISWDGARVIAAGEGHSNSSTRGHSSPGLSGIQHRWGPALREEGDSVRNVPWYHQHHGTIDIPSASALA